LAARAVNRLRSRSPARAISRLVDVRENAEKRGEAVI
jgi:hypothetical protein